MSMMLPYVEKIGLQLLLEPQTSGVIFRAACAGVGVVYPAYQSFKAIEDKKNAKQDDEQWLTYWAIFGLASLLEASVDEILAKAPYYYHAKLVLLLWLQMPNTQGARQLYTKYLRPPLVKYQPKIDIVLNKVTAVVGALYTIYKVPIDQAMALAAYGLGQAKSFLAWFTDGKSDGPAVAEGGSSKTASQFITR
mmetsp:Transcript_12421/g.30526  ORF Transcript_12421/g.30526 Transcript_12421/m.30526 type:complete len:193 (-) Transcript_12421:450-1028(-)